MKFLQSLGRWWSVSLILVVLAYAGTSNFTAIQIEPTSEDTTAFRILNTSATPVFSVSNAGVLTTSGAGGLALANGESINTDTDAVFDLTRNDAGTVTLTASDDNAVAALTVLPGGAAAMVLGGASTTAITLTTDGTGSAEVVLPTGSIATGEVLDGTLLAADSAFPGRGSFTVCGDLVTIADATPVFYGPSMALVESATVGLARTCNTAATGNVTEATADEPAYTATAFHVVSLDCIVQDVNITSVAFAARSAAAALTPAVGCTALDGQLGCVANAQTTTAIASAATFAIGATGSGADVGDVQFICTVNVAF